MPCVKKSIHPGVVSAVSVPVFEAFGSVHDKVPRVGISMLEVPDRQQRTCVRVGIEQRVYQKPRLTAVRQGAPPFHEREQRRDIHRPVVNDAVIVVVAAVRGALDHIPLGWERPIEGSPYGIHEATLQQRKDPPKHSGDQRLLQGGRIDRGIDAYRVRGAPVEPPDNVILLVVRFRDDRMKQITGIRCASVCRICRKKELERLDEVCLGQPQFVPAVDTAGLYGVHSEKFRVGVEQLDELLGIAADDDLEYIVDTAGIEVEIYRERYVAQRPGEVDQCRQEIHVAEVVFPSV